MNLPQYSNAGNGFFRSRLDDYHQLGMSYSDYWNKAYHDFIRSQIGGTDQGYQHVRDVENIIWHLIKGHEDEFPNEILFLLSLSAALHDCAKTGDDIDHASEGAKFLHGNLTNLGYVTDQSSAEAIAYIISSHTRGDFSNIPEFWPIGRDLKVHLKSIAAILRLADMMSTTEARASRVYNAINPNRTRFNEFLQDIRIKILSCKPSDSDPSIISVVARADDVQSQERIKAYVDGLNRDLTSEHKHLLENIRINFITVDFHLEDISFSLPTHFAIEWAPSILDELERKPIYTDADGHRNQNMERKLGIPSRLLPCYVQNNVTNIDILKDILDEIEYYNAIDSKFLYWNLSGTKEYLSLKQNPNYALPDTADLALRNCFPAIAEAVLKPSQDKASILIDLGVGDGREPHVMINTLLNMHPEKKIKCALVDFSYHMILTAINYIDKYNLESQNYRDRVDLFAINGDLRNLNRYKSVLQSNKFSNRFVCLLGGTFGNYREGRLTEQLIDFLTPDDSFILGVDLIGGRTEEDLILSYNSIYNQKFLFNPLEDVGFDQSDFDFDCCIAQNSSDVDAALTVESYFYNDAKRILVASSTKYVPSKLEIFLTDRFPLVVDMKYVNDEETYLILQLRKL